MLQVVLLNLSVYWRGCTLHLLPICQQLSLYRLLQGIFLQPSAFLLILSLFAWTTRHGVIYESPQLVNIALTLMLKFLYVRWNSQLIPQFDTVIFRPWPAYFIRLDFLFLIPFFNLILEIPLNKLINNLLFVSFNVGCGWYVFFVVLIENSVQVVLIGQFE